MPLIFASSRLTSLLLALTIMLPVPARAEEPEFYIKPSAPEQWTIGRRLDESQLRYCVDPRDPDWEVAAAIADAVAAALLLEPMRHVVESSYVTEDITKVYAILLEHCDFHMGFKLIPGGYSDWAMLTRAYYEADYVFVTTDPQVNSLGDLASTRPIGATLGTAAHIRLVSYLTAISAEDRWPTYPMGTNDIALASLLKGTVDAALVWAPTLWGKQRSDPAYASIRIINAAPLPETTLGVGALLLSDQTFLRTAFDEAVGALIADGTIASILEEYGFPAVARP